MKKIYLLACVLIAGFCHAQTPAYVPASGLVAWWGFSGNANDSSGNNNNLTVNGATLTADRYGNANSAYSFNGTSSYLTNSALSYAFSQSGAHSISFWINRTGTSDGVAMMSGSNAPSNFIWLIQSDTSKIVYGTNKQGSSWTWVNSPVYTAGSQWDHYVAVYNNQNMTLYKNGVSVGTNTNAYTSTTQVALPIYIGRAISGGYIAANIDDVGIWNRALSTSEINQLYSSTLSTKEVKTQPVSGSIAPNPAKNYIELHAPIKGSKTYTITDANGRLLSRGQVSDKEKIDVSALSKGIYFIETEGVKTLKFIKE
ncbi:LamG-like jellyroll fold domain-containing protein [uncultured Chryseobacterium sp.]|uniref:LamG-like jellyroll fold domain-containing protein n=1 Tax=uncultured Chryseobacterium sp. TaxID=259322 RepID=UPI0025F7870F|nr:LamG-like jellyroll fold domain-containing protein [uncultured Chryseobacterium sp.]